MTDERGGERPAGRTNHAVRPIKFPITRSTNPPINYPITRLSNYPINYPITRLPDYPIDRRIGCGESGFTLIELLVVASILVILAGIGLVQYRTSVIRAREAVLSQDLFHMRDAIDQYYADKGMYPPSIDDLVSSGYMRALPVDPFTKSPSTWQSVPSDPDPNNPAAAPGVYNVHSGSDGTALDGTKYADW